MKFKHAVRVRPAVTALAATVALGAVASPALAQVRIGVGPTVHHFKAYSDRIARVDRRAEQFRGRYSAAAEPGAQAPRCLSGREVIDR